MGTTEAGYLQRVEGSVNSAQVIAAFDAFAEQRQDQGLTRVMLDNAPIHHSHAFHERLEHWLAYGVGIHCLPPYSPELNLIEKAFLHLTQELRCEVDTLAHPPAALFAFACATLTYNVLAVVRAALCAVHGQETVEQLSGYYMAIELGHHAASLDTILDAEDWRPLRTASLDAFADWLRQQAARLNLRRYRKSRRGPKKPPPERVHDPKRPHVAVARILRQRRQGRSP